MLKVFWAAIVAAVVVAGLVVPRAESARAASCGSWRVQPSPNPGKAHAGGLSGVASTSASNAWAVGDRFGGVVRTLIEHWNGKEWTVQASPNASPGAQLLQSVAATSITNAWAVGYYGNSSKKTLIEHWNGKAWKIQPSPNPGDRITPT